jgi:hypothetical protein
LGQLLAPTVASTQTSNARATTTIPRRLERKGMNSDKRKWKVVFSDQALKDVATMPENGM